MIKTVRILSRLVIATSCSCLMGLVSQDGFAQSCEPDELWKLLAEDGASGDKFGWSVAVSGTTAIVGATDDDIPFNGGEAGAVYIYDTTTGTQTAKLVAADREANSKFGHAVAISGRVAIVGVPFDVDNGDNSGSAYLFDTGTGEQIAKMTPDDARKSDQFGFSVAISGSIAIVGAPGSSDSGAVFLFDADSGAQITKLLPTDAESGISFGSSVAVSGTTVIIGAVNDNDNGSASGSAYLFDTITGKQIAKLLPEDGDLLDFFGASVAINGTTAVVGAVWDEDNGLQSGSAYLFDATTGVQIAKLLSADGAIGDEFGYAVAINAETVVVGARHDGDSGDLSGSAYLFDANTGTQIAKILPTDAYYSSVFGHSLGVSGSTLIVGAYWDGYFDGTREIRPGAAYIFDISNTCPTLVVSPTPLQAGQNGLFVATNMAPTTASFLAYSLAGPGSTFISRLDITLDLAAPKQAGGLRQSNGAGTAQWVLSIPGGAIGRDVWFQACQGGVTTNVVATSVE